MKNGDYILVKAPEEYPVKKYRGRYCYEHYLVYWENTGELPKDGEIIHHINHDKHDNRFENLKLENEKEHVSKHTRARGIKMIEFICPSCGKVFSRQKRETSFSKGTRVDYCSRHCALKLQGKEGYGSIILRNYIKMPEEQY